jgi:DNA-binding CsgD family transcriptional regulator
MVCTAQTDPLLLKAVVNRSPSVVVLRRNRWAYYGRLCGWRGRVAGYRHESGRDRGLMLTREVNLTPHELECLVTQADGLGLKTSAKVMNISYRTVAAYRQNLSKRSDQGRQMTFHGALRKCRNQGTPLRV